MLSHIGEDPLEQFAARRMRVLAAEAGEPVGRDRMFEKDGPRPDLADESLRDAEPRDQSPLPWPQSPGQHRNAHFRAEIDQRNDVVQIVAIVVLVRTGDEQMLARDARRALEAFEMQPKLAGPVRQRVVDDRLDRRQVPFPKRHEERVAPDPALRRNEHAKRRKPVLIGEMLQHHRRRVDGVIDIVEALGVVPRIDAERMHPRPVLDRRDDLALRERRRQAALEGSGL